MDIASYGATPGIGSITETTERIIWWGREENLLYVSNRLIDSTTVDSGSTPTTDIRSGTVLGRKTSDGNYYPFNPDATDGTEIVEGVLLRDISMLDANGVAEDKFAHILLSGPLKSAQLFIEGSAFVGKNGEEVARRQMVTSGRFVLDDELEGRGAYLGLPLNEVNKAASYTVLAADNGTLFTMSLISTFTLPTLSAGLAFEFLSTVDANMLITSAAGNDIVYEDDAAATTITFSTGTEKLGAHIQVFANSAGTLWYCRDLSNCTGVPT
jgi:hypothetical protein